KEFPFNSIRDGRGESPHSTRRCDLGNTEGFPNANSFHWFDPHDTCAARFLSCFASSKLGEVRSRGSRWYSGFVRKLVAAPAGAGAARDRPLRDTHRLQ